MERWTQFRDAAGRLSVRHQPTLEKWQRIMTPVFASMANDETIHRAIAPMFATFESWCANGRVNEARAEEELRIALTTIKFLAKGGSKMEQAVSQPTPRQRATRLAETLYGDNRADWAESMPEPMKARLVNRALANAKRD